MQLFKHSACLLFNGVRIHIGLEQCALNTAQRLPGLHRGCTLGNSQHTCVPLQDALRLLIILQVLLLPVHRVLQIAQPRCRAAIGILQGGGIASIRRIAQGAGCAVLRFCGCRQGILRLAYLLRQLFDAGFHLFGKLCQRCGSLFAHAGGSPLLRGGLHRLDGRSDFIFCRKVRIISVACLVGCQIQTGRILCCIGISGLAGSVQRRHLIAQRFPQGTAADLYKFIRFV